MTKLDWRLKKNNCYSYRHDNSPHMRTKIPVFGRTLHKNVRFNTFLATGGGDRDLKKPLLRVGGLAVFFSPLQNN
jgi:hypothetical protein